ncbi:csnB [Candida oxycetoniae]|uniref:CsnB n=1 Tax=Candida oxycetoniae TaxID=497107 RepID=A0AAI9SUQ0_9ASCO|nr:csnB [Candida oxycetoniae]KAI3403252.2 csnB [Candida oxycetoniae]
MSDEEIFSEDSYEFEFEEEESGDVLSNDDDGRISQDEAQGIENKYYTAKAVKDDEPNQAIANFRNIVENYTSDDQVDWVFRAFKQLIKLYFNQANYQEVLNLLKQAIPLLPRLSKSYAEESLSRMIVRYSNVSQPEFIHDFYQILLDQNYFVSDKLSLKINSNLLNLLMENGETDRVPQLLEKIHARFQTVPESIQKLFALEIIAAEIEYLFQINKLDLPMMNKLYNLSSKNTTAVTHPKIMGIIKECGAKVQFYRNNYQKAKYEFYQSFKSYDEAGSFNLQKNKNLKYLALCSLLTDSELDPFQNQETQTYSQFSEFDNLKKLIHAYHSLDLDGFEKVLQDKSDSFIQNDDIFKHASKEILNNLRSKVLLKYLSTFPVISFSSLCDKLKLPNGDDDLEQLLVRLMHQGKLKNSKVDNIEKLVYQSSRTDLVVPTTPKSIYYNIKSLDSLTVQASDNNTKEENNNNTDEMIIDGGTNLFFADAPNPSTSTLSSKFFFLIDRPIKIEDWFDAISKWYTYMMSSIPESFKSEISHKEQITMERQRAESIVNLAAQNELAKFNTGLLNSTTDGLIGEEKMDDDEVSYLKRINLLKAWVNVLQD